MRANFRCQYVDYSVIFLSKTQMTLFPRTPLQNVRTAVHPDKKRARLTNETSAPPFIHVFSAKPTPRRIVRLTSVSFVAQLPHYWDANCGGVNCPPEYWHSLHTCSLMLSIAVHRWMRIPAAVQPPCARSRPCNKHPDRDAVLSSPYILSC